MSTSLTGRGAKFSACRKYRYLLWRIWGKRWINFLMLNPSKADENDNDQTVERCERRARALGFGGLIVTNIFALCSTDPRALRKCKYPEGKFNDRCILHAVTSCEVTVCAWGNHGLYRGRGDEVLRDLAFNHQQAKLHSLGLTKHGQPTHPLYLPYSLKPIPMFATFDDD